MPQAPQLSHDITAVTSPTTTREVSDEIPREISHEIEAADVGGLPDLRVNIDSAAALLPKPTVLSIPASIMSRFSRARREADSHTGVVLDSLRVTVGQLPDLVAAARPQPRAGDLFPFRANAAKERRDPLRVRPTVAELAVIDRIVDWVADEIDRRQPGSAKVSRSEVVAAALDVYLPSRRKASGE